MLFARHCLGRVEQLGSAAVRRAASAAIPANMQINETDFLQLISTQLQNQDPLQPTDPSQFLGQLEGLSEVSSLQSMQSAMSASQITQWRAVLLLGQSVLAPGTTATLATVVRSPVRSTRPGRDDTDCCVTVAIPAACRSPPSRSHRFPGMTNFSWNGTTSSGTTAPAGQYTISVNATVNGASQPVTPMVVSRFKASPSIRAPSSWI